MAKFIRNREVNREVEQVNFNYSEINNEKVENKVEPVVVENKHAGFRFNKKEEKKSEPKQQSQMINNEKKDAANKSTNNSISDWKTTSKILPKFVNKSAKASFGSAVEFSKASFELCKRNDNGYRESLDSKLLMNYWTFDKNSNKQSTLIPTYIDVSEWLNVCHMILSGRLHEMTEEARIKQEEGKYKYCGFIYQSIGGSYKPIFKINGKPFGGPDGSPIATIFKITPAGIAGTKDKWTFTSEIQYGKTGETGLIEPAKGGSPLAKITVLLTYDDLVRIARMSEMAIMAHMMKLQ